jgi:organic hydroperoxide reductase OsmC/OhrA
MWCHCRFRAPMRLTQKRPLWPHWRHVTCCFFWIWRGRRGFVVDSYRDQAVGEMDKTGDGGDWVQTVHLYPKAAWQGAAPDSAALSDLHHRAHKLCFIANSVKSEIITHLD